MWTRGQDKGKVRFGSDGSSACRHFREDMPRSIQMEGVE